MVIKFRETKNKLPVVSPSGVIQIGQHLDFLAMINDNTKYRQPGKLTHTQAQRQRRSDPVHGR